LIFFKKKKKKKKSGGEKGVAEQAQLSRVLIDNHLHHYRLEFEFKIDLGAKHTFPLVLMVKLKTG
jgi:hypothetical protein